MKICYVVPAIVNKAPVLIALQLCRRMRDKGHEVTVIYFDENVEVDLVSDVIFKRVSFYSSFDFSSYDLVHSHMLRPDAFVFKNRAFFGKVRYVSTLHNYVEEELYFYYSKLISKVFSFVWNVCWLRHDRLVVLSDHAAVYYSKFSFNKNISRVYNGRDVTIDYGAIESWCSTEIELLRAKVGFVIGTYCVLTARKGVDQLIKFLVLNPEAGLVVIGDGPEKESLKALSVSQKVEARCLFLPALHYAHQCNKFFDVFAMPSRSEGFGLALVEAALHSKKIICSDISIFRELFDEETISFFKVDDIVDLDNVVRQCLFDDSKVSLLLKVARAKYSSEAMADNYLKVYEELVNG